MASARKPGGAMMMVGNVDANGLGVPFKLCTIYTRMIVTDAVITVAVAIARYLLFILIAMVSSILISMPPKRNV